MKPAQPEGFYAYWLGFIGLIEATQRDDGSYRLPSLEEAARAAYLAGMRKAADICETHDSSMARLGGGLYDSDREALRVRGRELAHVIRERAAREGAET